MKKVRKEDSLYIPSIVATKIISCELNHSFQVNKKNFENEIFQSIQNGWFIKDSIQISIHPTHKFQVCSQLLVKYT